MCQYFSLSHGLNNEKKKSKRSDDIKFYLQLMDWKYILFLHCSGKTNTLQSTFGNKEGVLLFDLLGFVGRRPAAGAGTWPVAARDKGDSESNTAGATLTYHVFM